MSDNIQIRDNLRKIEDVIHEDRKLILKLENTLEGLNCKLERMIDNKLETHETEVYDRLEEILMIFLNEQKSMQNRMGQSEVEIAKVTEVIKGISENLEEYRLERRQIKTNFIYPVIVAIIIGVINLIVYLIN